MDPHHPRCGGRPERCSRADGNKPSRILPRRSKKAQKIPLRLGFLVKDSKIMTSFLTIFTLRTFYVKNLVCAEPLFVGSYVHFRKGKSFTITLPFRLQRQIRTRSAMVRRGASAPTGAGSSAMCER